MVGSDEISLRARARRPLVLLVLLCSFGSGTLAAAQWPPPWPEVRAQRIAEPVFGGHAYVYQAGEGQARSIVLVHGIGEAGARDFAGLIPWLVAQGWHVLAFDLPGFGYSDKANALYSPGHYAAFVAHVAHRYARRPFTLLGHSMGAVVALRYAADHPEDVQRLVVMSAPGILHRLAYTSHYVAQLGKALLPPFLDPEQRIATLARKMLGVAERTELDPQAILASPRLRARLLGENPAQIAGLALALEDFSERLPRLGLPVLLLWGAEDRLAPPRIGKLLAAVLPRSRLVLLADTGHVPMSERPQALVAALEPFLRGEADPPPAAAHAARAGTSSQPKRMARCERRHKAVFEGEYDTVVLNRCRQALIQRARIRALRVLYSMVEIEDSSIGERDSGGGLYARSSTVIVTGGRIAGEVPITALSSRLDLAGVALLAREIAVAAPARSSVVFSLSRIESPAASRPLHGYYTLSPDKPLKAAER